MKTYKIQPEDKESFFLIDSNGVPRRTSGTIPRCKRCSEGPQLEVPFAEYVFQGVLNTGVWADPMPVCANCLATVRTENIDRAITRIKQRLETDGMDPFEILQAYAAQMGLALTRKDDE